MRRDPLGQALREAAIPIPAKAEQRGLEVVEAAYAERQLQPRRQPAALPRLAVAFAAVTLLAALLLSPAGAAVRDWVDDAITTSTPRPEPGLAEIPGGGRLLVQSAVGPWVVQPDGSRRLLGDYEEATWSPRGLFVGAASGRTLSAVEPDGDPRWSITAPARVADPRWSPSGYRIAYRAGSDLRVVTADGTADHLIAETTAPVAPAWAPAGGSQLAFLSTGKLRVADSESAALILSAPALPDIAELEWGGGGSAILEASRRALRLRSVRADKLAGGPALGVGRRLSVPAGATVVDAAIAPERPVVAAVLTRWRNHGTRSSVLLFGPDGRRRRLLAAPGSLGEVTWSPDGRRVLVAWPAANQWLFLPAGRGEPRAVVGVSRAFSPGGRDASFPRVEGWCCRR
jgi:dipeptidyl aminopeptidase/acylaminoacyl peptidase